MKVLNLHCAQGHVFEGWFANEDDFQSQQARALLCCPVCQSPDIRKGLSAPRLNLASESRPADAGHADPAAPVAHAREAVPAALVQAWLELSRRMVAGTQDVGERFAEEARKMHYGETEDRGIRGQATLTEVRDLLDEGIEVLPLLLPEASKHTLQ